VFGTKEASYPFPPEHCSHNTISQERKPPLLPLVFSSVAYARGKCRRAYVLGPSALPAVCRMQRASPHPWHSSTRPTRPLTRTSSLALSSCRRSIQSRQAPTSLPPAGDVAGSGEAGAKPWTEVLSSNGRSADVCVRAAVLFFLFGKIVCGCV
jgi:hypothetical protein